MPTLWFLLCNSTLSSLSPSSQPGESSLLDCSTISHEGCRCSVTPLHSTPLHSLHSTHSTTFIVPSSESRPRLQDFQTPRSSRPDPRGPAYTHQHLNPPRSCGCSKGRDTHKLLAHRRLGRGAHMWARSAVRVVMLVGVWGGSWEFWREQGVREGPVDEDRDEILVEGVLGSRVDTRWRNRRQYTISGRSLGEDHGEMITAR
jgi:hypothetical protein